MIGQNVMAQSFVGNRKGRLPRLIHVDDPAADGV
jgi:hypothetical protein